MDHSKDFISLADAARAIEAYNDALLDVCRSHHLECFDLAAAAPKDSSAFLDDSHFNENGACIVARVLMDYFCRTPPFTGPGSSLSQRRP